MVKPTLVNRTRFTSSMENKLWKKFGDLSKKLRIDKSRLFDEAIEDLIIKYSDGNQRDYLTESEFKRLFPELAHTWDWKEHPEDHEGECACQLCRSYQE